MLFERFLLPLQYNTTMLLQSAMLLAIVLPLWNLCLDACWMPWRTMKIQKKK